MLSIENGMYYLLKLKVALRLSALLIPFTEANASFVYYVHTFYLLTSEDGFILHRWFLLNIAIRLFILNMCYRILTTAISLMAMCQEVGFLCVSSVNFKEHASFCIKTLIIYQL